MSNEEKIEITDVGVINKLTELDNELNISSSCLLPFEKLEIKIIADKDFFKRNIVKKFNLDSSYGLLINILKNESIEQEINKEYTLFSNGIKEGIIAEYSKYEKTPQNLNTSQKQREQKAYQRIKIRVQKIEEEKTNILKIIGELKKIYSENKEHIHII